MLRLAAPKREVLAIVPGQFQFGILFDVLKPLLGTNPAALILEMRFRTGDVNVVAHIDGPLEYRIAGADRARAEPNLPPGKCIVIWSGSPRQEFSCAARLSRDFIAKHALFACFGSTQ